MSPLETTGAMAVEAVLEDAAPAPGPLSHLVGRTLGRTYRVLRLLDHGGMGVVFLARHERLGRHVAVKIMSHHLASDSNALARFQREAEVVSRIEHPHVVQILDFDRSDGGEPFIVMELLHGESLGARLDRERLLPVAEVVRIASQIASGLAAAHEANVVHRDLKPANVFLVAAAGEAPFVKLLDFGISKSARDSGRLTLDRDLVGTPFYMAPEQATGHGSDVDHRADQFALAALVYEMLTGNPAFAAETVMAVLRRVMDDEPAPASRLAPWVPAAVDAVLARGLAKIPGRRYQTIGAFAAALAEAAAGAEAPPAGIVVPPPPARENTTVRVGDGRTLSRLAPDETAGVTHALEHARAELGRGDLDAAVDAAEASIAAARQCGSGGLDALTRGAPLLERIYEDRVGSLDTYVVARPAAKTAADMTPQQAFILSRLDAPLTAAELLDVASVARPQAMRLIAILLRRKLIAPLSR